MPDMIYSQGMASDCGDPDYEVPGNQGNMNIGITYENQKKDINQVKETTMPSAKDVDIGTEFFKAMLVGTYGTGKSVFARAVLRELGVKGSIPSPSFIVDAVYSAAGLEIHHIDLYRLKGIPDEMEFYGIYAALQSDAAIIVEWAERLDAAILRHGIFVSIGFTGDPKMREVKIDDRSLAGN